jgi:hypothetical protein
MIWNINQARKGLYGAKKMKEQNVNEPQLYARIKDEVLKEGRISSKDEYFEVSLDVGFYGLPVAKTKGGVEFYIDAVDFYVMVDNNMVQVQIA